MTVDRVVVTGLGVVSALGHSIEQFWQTCREGRTYVEPIPSHWSNYYESKSKSWSPLVPPDYESYGLTRADALRYDPVVLNAVVAADQAIENAGLEKTVYSDRARSYQLEGIDPDRLGVFIGTGLGCISSAFTNYVPHLLRSASDALFAEGRPDGNAIPVQELHDNLKSYPRVSPFASVQSMANAIAAQLSIRYRARAAAETLIYACASGTAAICRAFRAIQNREVDIAIAGGSEYYGDRAGGVFMAFDRMQTLVMPTESLDQGNRPFDRDRTGFLFSQGGAGMVLIESEKHARERGASYSAAIKGMSITADANSLAAISEENNAIESMFSNLLRDADVEAATIDYINAHGTSTVQNDLIEAKILDRVFPHKPYVNSTKALLGHTIAASGTIEFIVSVLSMRDSIVHGCRNLKNPVYELNFPIHNESAPIKFALTHSFGFGGHNAGLIIENVET